MRGRLKAAVWGPVDQSALEDRDDVLVYGTQPLAEPLAFAGNLEAKLFVSTDTPDADWVVKVVDVRPDGVGDQPRQPAFFAVATATRRSSRS
jgi:predicted acyl esterase